MMKDMAYLPRKRTILLTILVLLIGVASAVVIRRKTEAPSIDQTHNSSQPNTTNQSATTKTEPTLQEQIDTLKAKHSVDDPVSIWVVVNKTRPFNPKEYAPADLTSVGGGQQLRSEAAQSFKAMQDAAKAQGLTIGALSGYRSYATQVSVYANEVKAHGQAVADTQSARPGTSEHQSGWALDVGGGGCGIEDCFGTTAEGKWVAANAYQYGFIIRYTADKQAVTGYRAEPWHLRYIGTELSVFMHEHSYTTLEEFFGLPAAPQYPAN